MKPTTETQRHKGEPRVFYCPEAAERFEAEKGFGFRVGLSQEESHHAAKVLRLAVGDEVRLFDGAGYFYDGKIASLARHETQVRIESRAASTSDPRARLILLVALLKGRKADFLIQKAVELGVGEIVFFQARRSVSQTRAPDKEEEESGQEEEGSGRERWEKIVVSACKQCGRATLMPVRELPDLNAALRALPHTPIRYVFWEALSQDSTEGEPAACSIGASVANHEIVAMIGPEGGFTEEEIARVVAAGFRACSLGPRILRAETAALAAAAILLHNAGELGSEKQLTTVFHESSAHPKA
jgi:16S rRNA (uracil1498-N3)-methyltransferase